MEIVDLSHAIVFWVVLFKKKCALRASFRSAVANHDRTIKVWGAWLLKQDAKPCFRASAHRNQELHVPQWRGANQNPDAPFSCLVMEKALWSQYSPPLSNFVVLGWKCVLKGGKKTSDLAEYFLPFKTQIGPKIKKNGQRLLFCFLAHCQTDSELGYQSRCTPTSLQKLVRSKLKSFFFLWRFCYTNKILCWNRDNSRHQFLLNLAYLWHFIVALSNWISKRVFVRTRCAVE